MNPARRLREAPLGLSWPRLPLALAGAMLAAGCAGLPGADPASEPNNPIAAAWGQVPEDQRAADFAGWEHQPFPGKSRTRFTYLTQDGRPAVLAYAKASASMKRVRVNVPPEALGTVQFSWKVPGLIAKADMGRRDLDDSTVRVVLVFDGDRSRFSPRDAMLSELARALTGEEMPYATLMYVWSKNRQHGEVIVNPRTSRIRKIVLESGTANLGRWMDYERDIRADYERAFGEPPGALVGLGIMTDSDNTGSVTQAWYGPVRLVRTAATAP